VSHPPLFRVEALNHRRHSIAGEILVSVAPGWSAISWLMIVTVTALVAFLMTSQFSRKETVPGILVSHPDLIRVRALKPGTIETLLVNIGDTVQRGQALFTVAVDAAESGGREVAEAQLVQLDAEAAGLDRQKALERSIAQQRGAELSLRMDKLDQQITGLQQKQKIQNRTNELLADQVAAIEGLTVKGYASKVELRRRQTDLQDGRIAAQSIAGDLSIRQAERATAQAELQKLPGETQLKLSQLDTALSGIAQRRADAVGRATYSVTAPAAGRVDLLQVEPGQAIAAGMTAVAIQPADAQLTAELFVPSRAVAFLKPDQRVRIAYDAFPYVQFGFADGKVAGISYTVLHPAELSQPVKVTEPVYRVSAKLDKPTMLFQQQQLPLRAGMALSGDIILERRSLLDWLLVSVQEVWNRT
jgi:membrane fusion protein